MSDYAKIIESSKQQHEITLLDIGRTKNVFLEDCVLLDAQYCKVLNKTDLKITEIKDVKLLGIKDLNLLQNCLFYRENSTTHNEALFPKRRRWNNVFIDGEMMVCEEIIDFLKTVTMDEMTLNLSQALISPNQPLSQNNHFDI